MLVSGASGGLSAQSAGPCVLLVLACLVACGPPPTRPTIEMEPIGTFQNVPTTPLPEPTDSEVTTPNSGTPLPGASPCSASELDNLEETLKACETSMPKASEVTSIRDKLEVKITTSSASTTPGGRIEVQITLRNKTNDPLALYFTGDPTPRFDIEAVDAKGRRADLPPTKFPGYPKGMKPEAREAKAAKVTLSKLGAARLKLTWDAVKTKWAPERAKVWEGRGPPRVTAGPLPPGKYTLRVVLPLIGDVDVPKVPVEVTRP